MKSLHRLAASVLACAILGATGCGLGTLATSSPAVPTPASGSALFGTVHGGQQPIIGATIQLYAAGTSGYGTGAIALLPALTSGTQYYLGGAPGCIASGSQACYYSVVTDGNGDFSITGDYTCPSGATSQIYIVATGGNPGGGTNSAVALMAALGSCDSDKTLLTTSSPITIANINEVTTVAAVTALQQFMSVTNGTPGAFSIGAPSTTYGGVETAAQGMTNAFGTANKLADLATGLSLTTTASIPESDRIYALANVLASCVNSTDAASAASTSAGCPTLFSDVKPDSASIAPSDTIQAMFSIATNPTYNVGTIFGLSSGMSPFTGALASAPNDFSIAIAYAPTYNNGTATVSSVQSPYGIAIDAYGNAWISDSGSSSTFYGLTELGPTGALLTGPITSFSASGGYTGGNPSLASSTRAMNGPRIVAIDQANNAWVANSNGNASNAGFTPVGTILVAPGSTAANVGSKTGASATTNSNAVGYYAPFTTTGLTVDTNNNVYVTAGTTTPNFGKYSNASGTFTLGGAVGTSPLVAATDLSSDTGPFLYISSQAACSNVGEISVFNTNTLAATQVISSAPASSCASVTDQISATTSEPTGIAVDANNNLWVTEYTTTTSTGGVSYLVQSRSGSTASSGTGAVGTTSTASTTLSASGGTDGLKEPFWVAVDGNNNAWLGNANNTTISEFSVSTTSGSPVITPLTGSNGLVHNEAASKLDLPKQIAIDASGNIWTSNNFSSATWTTVVVGVAAPVVTPLSQALASHRIGQKP